MGECNEQSSEQRERRSEQYEMAIERCSASYLSPIERWTMPILNEFKKQLPKDIKEKCRDMVPIYTDAMQARCVQIQQGTQEWLELRLNRLTGSNFGSAVGHNKYKAPKKLLQNLLWPETDVVNDYGKTAMAWGTKNESMVRKFYESYIAQMSYAQRRVSFDMQDPLKLKLPESVLTRIREYLPMTHLEHFLNHVYQHSRSYDHNEIVVIEMGFCIPKTHPWLGTSPDGLICRYDASLKRLLVVGLLEIKCPYKQTFYPEIPEYYYDQIQGFMNLFDIAWCDFVVWIPGSMRVDNVKCDPQYWNSVLFPKLEEFYFGRYLPFRILQQFQLLQKNSVVPVFQWDE